MPLMAVYTPVPYRLMFRKSDIRYGNGCTRNRITLIGIWPYTIYGTVLTPSGVATTLSAFFSDGAVDRGSITGESGRALVGVSGLVLVLGRGVSFQRETLARLP